MIRFTYFKPSGKAYASEDIEDPPWWVGISYRSGAQIVARFVAEHGHAPGLSTDASGFFVVIENVSDGGYMRFAHPRDPEAILNAVRAADHQRDPAQLAWDAPIGRRS